MNDIHASFYRVMSFRLEGGVGIEIKVVLARAGVMMVNMNWCSLFIIIQYMLQTAADCMTCKERSPKGL